MERLPRVSSIFSQTLDRAAYVAYFLGAVLPLVALGYLAHFYVLPTIEDDYVAYGILGVAVSMGTLSLCSFFVLRHTTRQSLQRMDDDNLRLGQLLKVSRSLSFAPHGGEVRSAAVRCALDMTGACAAFVLTRDKSDQALAVRESAGEQAEQLFESHEATIVEMAEVALADTLPVVGRAGEGAAAAVLPIEGQDKGAAVLVGVRRAPAAEFQPAEVDSLSTLASFTSVALRNADLHDARQNFFTHVTDLLTTAVDRYLDRQAGHGHRVAEFSNRIGRVLGLDDGRLEQLHFASLLHDIGMLKIERSIQHNRTACEKHPAIGFRMLSRIRLWEEIAPVVLHHHEWFDGSGYPEGLAEEDIPVEARIISVADAFDAMTSSTSYKPAMSVEEAVGELKGCSGTQFDPKAVDVLVELVASGAIQAATEA